MMRFIVGFDISEFNLLFFKLIPNLKNNFSRTPIMCNECENETEVLHLDLRLILFLVLIRFSHLNSFRFLPALICFNCSHLCNTIKKYEILILKTLFEVSLCRGISHQCKKKL